MRAAWRGFPRSALFAGGLALVLSAGAAGAQAPAVPTPDPTPAERDRYLSFTEADEVLPYLAALADGAADVELARIGPDGRIPVLRIGPTGGVGAEAVVRVLVIGAQHGDERAGLEVGLRLARDLVAGPLRRLRDALDVRIVPMANPTGVADQRRTTPDGVDLAGDHLVLRSPEARALWAEFRAWRPHVVLDLHELGPTEYTVQIAVPTHPNVHPTIYQLARYYLLPHAANALARADVRFHEYVSPWLGDETREAAAVPATGGEAWFTPAATDPARARNAFALAGSVAFFLATASSRDILGLEERVGRLHVAAAALLEAAGGLGAALLPGVAAAGEAPEEPLAVRHHYGPRDEGGALPWIFINDRGLRESGELTPWRPRLVVDSAAAPPAGWWVEARDTTALRVLRAHGFLDLRDAIPPPGALAARPAPDAVWVPAGQPAPRLLFTLLEAADSDLEARRADE